MSKNENFTRLVSCGIENIKKYVTDISNQSVYPSVKSKLRLEKFFRKIIHHLDPEVREMLGRGIFGNENSTFHLVHYLLAIEIKISIFEAYIGIEF